MTLLAGEVHYASLTDISKAIHSREVSPVEVTRALLERIERLNPSLGAFYSVFGAEAMQEAAVAEAEIGRGRWRGPLHGIPVAFKDLYLSGPTTGGSPLLDGYVAGREAAAVVRLREAGAVVLGKLATHEFGLAAATLADHFPPARNPWDPDRTPGGSSTGAGTALAAGLAFGAFGTDTGGSVRLPAAFSGVVGFKPTFGRVSTEGVIPLSRSLDHAGPLARSVADTAALMTPFGLAVDALDGGAEGLRVAVPKDFWAPRCDPQVAARFGAALAVLEGSGAQVVDIELGFGVVDAMAVGYLIALTEAAAYHLPTLRGNPFGYGSEFGLVLRSGLLVPGQAYVAAQEARARMSAAVARVLDSFDDSFDILAMPTVGMLADPLPDRPRHLTRRISTEPAPQYTWLANLTGGPAVSVPCGFSEAPELPVGLQLLGRRDGDALVLRAAHAYERSAGWWHRHPPLFP